MTFYASDWAIKQNPSQNDYTGIVVAINDPLKDNRARIRIPFLHSGIPDEYLPWYRNGNIQGNVNGTHEIKLPVVGSTVKVAFENDDFYTGTFYNGYIDTSNNADDSFLDGYGTFDGWKDQWGNSFKRKENGFTYLMKNGVTFSVNGTALSISGITSTNLSGDLTVDGNITATTGNITATAGNITATAGTVSGAHLGAGDGATNNSLSNLSTKKVKSGIILNS